MKKQKDWPRKLRKKLKLDKEKLNEQLGKKQKKMKLRDLKKLLSKNVLLLRKLKLRQKLNDKNKLDFKLKLLDRKQKMRD